MTFLQVSLLAGLVAAGIPIALHLIARREPQKVVFGSIAFLTRHYASNRSKMQLRRWWLLLLRVLALVLLTLALASPVIGSSLVSQWNAALVALVLAIGFLAAGTIAFLRGLSKQLALGLAAVGGLLVALSLGSGAYLAATGPVVRGSSGGPIAVAVLVDNGPLSNLRSGDRIALDRDRETAQALIERLPRGSEWVIVDRSTVPANLTSDPAALPPRLESLKARHLAVDFRTRFGEARRALERSPLASKHVVILADRAKPTWESWIEADSGSTRGRTEKNRKASETAETGETSGTGETPQAIETSQTREVAPAGTDLHWVVAGRPPGLRTVSIVEAKLSDPLPAPEVPLRMTVTLRQQGDGRDRESDNPVQNVSVQVGRFPPDASLPLVRDGKLIRPEPEWVDRKSIALLPNQEATLDLTVPPLELGSHTIVLEVADPDDLLIDQQRFLTLAVRQPPEILVVAADEDSSFVLGQTLDPFAGQNQVGSPVASILERDLPITDLSPFAAIALADPTPEILNDVAFEAFLDRGGLVMVALGPRVANATDPTVPSETLPAWLPTPKRVWRRTEPPTFFTVTDPTSPLTSALAADTPWNEFPVQQYWQVETSDQDRVPIRMAGTDHPALVRRSLESGGTVLLTSTPIPALDERASQWN
ncbi:MAG: BatA domain-containing protein, partial [Planctomycetota bacterium]